MTAKIPDARELLATGEWEVTSCGLVRKGHPEGMYVRTGEYHDCTPVNPGELDRATRWLQEVAIPCKRPKGDSYGLKHRAEHWAAKNMRPEWTTDYVSNGALIQAALNLGLPVHPCDMHRVDAINAIIPVKGPKEEWEVWR